MIKVGIVGGAGYTGGELIRILLGHPEAEIKWINSKSNAGNPIHKVHRDLIGYSDLVFTDQLDWSSIDALVICLGHGDAKVFVDNNDIPSSVKIVDLSTDYRHVREGNDFVYGLPEMNKASIASAQYVANPGCFATCIQLGILPMAAAGLVSGEIHVTAITGSTGAGQKPTATSHFSWRNSNLSVYKAFNHQHLTEINQSLGQLQDDYVAAMNFVPFRGDFTRGIIASIYLDTDKSQEEIDAIYADFYADAPFTHVVDENPDLKQVVNTNNALVYAQVIDGKVHIISEIDNLLKGASGQAVQNLNLMFGLPERTGLGLKPSGF